MSGVRNLFLKMHLYESMYDASTSPAWNMLLYFLAIIFSEIKGATYFFWSCFSGSEAGVGSLNCSRGKNVGPKRRLLEMIAYRLGLIIAATSNLFPDATTALEIPIHKPSLSDITPPATSEEMTSIIPEGLRHLQRLHYNSLLLLVVTNFSISS